MANPVFDTTKCSVAVVEPLPSANLISDGSVPPAPSPIPDCGFTLPPVLPTNIPCQKVTVGGGDAQQTGEFDPTITVPELVVTLARDGQCGSDLHFNLKLPPVSCPIFTTGTQDFTLDPHGTTGTVDVTIEQPAETSCAFRVNASVVLPGAAIAGLITDQICPNFETGATTVTLDEDATDGGLVFDFTKPSGPSVCDFLVNATLTLPGAAIRSLIIDDIICPSFETGASTITIDAHSHTGEVTFDFNKPSGPSSCDFTVGIDLALPGAQIIDLVQAYISDTYGDISCPTFTSTSSSVTIDADDALGTVDFNFTRPNPAECDFNVSMALVLPGAQIASFYHDNLAPSFTTGAQGITLDPSATTGTLTVTLTQPGPDPRNYVINAMVVLPGEAIVDLITDQLCPTFAPASEALTIDPTATTGIVELDFIPSGGCSYTYALSVVLPGAAIVGLITDQLNPTFSQGGSTISVDPSSHAGSSDTTITQTSPGHYTITTSIVLPGAALFDALKNEFCPTFSDGAGSSVALDPHAAVGSVDVEIIKPDPNVCAFEVIPHVILPGAAIMALVNAGLCPTFEPGTQTLIVDNDAVEGELTVTISRPDPGVCAFVIDANVLIPLAGILGSTDFTNTVVHVVTTNTTIHDYFVALVVDVINGAGCPTISVPVGGATVAVDPTAVVPKLQLTAVKPNPASCAWNIEAHLTLPRYQIATPPLGGGGGAGSNGVMCSCAAITMPQNPANGIPTGAPFSIFGGVDAASRQCYLFTAPRDGTYTIKLERTLNPGCPLSLRTRPCCASPLDNYCNIPSSVPVFNSQGPCDPDCDMPQDVLNGCCPDGMWSTMFGNYVYAGGSGIFSMGYEDLAGRWSDAITNACNEGFVIDLQMHCTGTTMEFRAGRGGDWSEWTPANELHCCDFSVAFVVILPDSCRCFAGPVYFVVNKNCYIDTTTSTTCQPRIDFCCIERTMTACEEVIVEVYGGFSTDGAPAVPTTTTPAPCGPVGYELSVWEDPLATICTTTTESPGCATTTTTTTPAPTTTTTTTTTTTLAPGCPCPPSNCYSVTLPVLTNDSCNQCSFYAGTYTLTHTGAAGSFEWAVILPFACATVTGITLSYDSGTDTWNLGIGSGFALYTCPGASFSCGSGGDFALDGTDTWCSGWPLTLTLTGTSCAGGG
jgi:hypothetical protein